MPSLDATSVTAVLRDADDKPLAGKLLSFRIGASTRTATTDSDGRATASVPLTDLPDSYRLSAAFAGDDTYAGSSDARDGFTIERLETTLTLSRGHSELTETQPGPTATLAFTSDGRINGSTGCNSFGGTYTSTGPALKLTLGAMTQMACADPAYAA